MQRGLSLDSRKHVTSKLVEMRPDHAQDKQPSPTPLTCCTPVQDMPVIQTKHGNAVSAGPYNQIANTWSYRS